MLSDFSKLSHNKRQAMNGLNFEGREITIDSEDLSFSLLSALIDCGGRDVDDASIDFVMNKFSVTGDPEDCKSILRNYGSWTDEDELFDHEENLRRLVWLTACEIVVNEVAYFNAG